MALRINNAADPSYELNSELERLKRYLDSVGLEHVSGGEINHD